MKCTLWFGAAMFFGSMAAVALETPKAGEELKDAKEILIKVDEATKKLQAVRYSASSKGTGGLESRAPAIEGTVVLVGKSEDGGPKKFRVEAKGKRPESSETVEFTAGADGATFFVVDPKNKTVYEDIDRGVLGSFGRMAQALVVLEFCHPKPFSDEIEADTQELLPDKKIGSEDCYQVRVVYKGGQGESIWCFSKKDFLPRGRERVSKTPEGRFVYELTALTADPKVPDDAFKASVPEGFKKTDEYAP